MRNITTALFLFISVVCFAQKQSDESVTEQFVLRLHEKKFQWMINGNVEFVMKLIQV